MQPPHTIYLYTCKEQAFEFIDVIFMTCSTSYGVVTVALCGVVWCGIERHIVYLYDEMEDIVTEGAHLCTVRIGISKFAKF